MRSLNGVRAIAALEAAKGALVLVAGFGLLSLIHRDAQQVAEQVVSHLHLNPANRYPRIFISAAAALSDVRLMLLAVGAAAYALVRFVEAYGLWRGRRWAEWFAAVSGAIYIPFEIYELIHRASWLSIGALSVNVFVVGYMSRALLRSRQDAARKCTTLIR
ncbi:MAG: DUF2127 domain-containing protein [Pseudomonadota bacterium]|nr:DUF2127 domain-containing protein [Pseudomonadota bacterium]